MKCLNNTLKKIWKIKYVLPFLFVSFILGVAVLATSLSYRKYQEHFISNLSEEHVNTLSQVNSNINKIKDEIVTISDMFYNDVPLNQIIFSPANSSFEDSHSYLASLDKQIHDTLAHYSFDYEIQLICSNGFLYSTDKAKESNLTNYCNELWYYNAKSSNEPLYWLPSIRMKASIAYDKSYFSLMRFFKTDSEDSAALLMVNVPENALFDTYKDLLTDSDSNIYLVDKNGQIVSHKEKFMIGHYYYKMSKFYELFDADATATIMKSNTPYLFSKYEHPDSSWIVVEEIPMSSIQKPFLEITKNIIFMVSCISVLSIFIAVFISNYISKQISRVCKAMEDASSGDLNIIFPHNGFQEIRIISCACENFVVRIASLLNDIKKKEHLKQVTELRFYQMQINPHFMHNTLFTIKCMIDMGMREQACKTIDSLNIILKNILNTEQKLATVEEEIETLKNYTFILQQRYSNSFEISFVTEPHCLKLLILRFILQPIVENAVFHGVCNKPKHGVIIVKVADDSNNIYLSVKDNGVGMSQDIINAIMGNMNRNSKHIGLNNVRSRLQLHYGADASFNIRSIPDHGTEVVITVPKYKI